VLINMPSLTNVDLLSIFSNLALPDITFPSLTSVSGYFEIYLHTALTDISFRSLTSVGGYFQIHDNLALLDMSFPLLTSVGGIINTGWSNEMMIYKNNLLMAMNFSSLTSIHIFIY